jgi:hypothetical protein
MTNTGSKPIAASNRNQVPMQPVQVESISVRTLQNAKTLSAQPRKALQVQSMQNSQEYHNML